MTAPSKSWEPLFSLQHWDDIVTHHTTDVESLPSFQRDAYIGDYTPDYTSLLRAPAHDDPFLLQCVRNQRTGEFLYQREVLKSAQQSNDKSVRSFASRAPAPDSEGAKGSATGRSFWPGGFSDSENEEEEEELEEAVLDFANNLLAIPPGFDRGMKFGEENLAAVEDESKNIQELITMLDELMVEQKTKAAERKDSTKHKSITEDDSDTEESSESKSGGRYQWAVELDAESDVPDFYNQIVNLAYQFPFELDPFQKQAILKLHTHDNVMVAAHTSAGKTVVAEYAIALSNHHMTKVIYTAPIKALSNQKFRDFKEKFGEVGLLTGDIQINTSAPCLIMTTEILRSMLYNGSDITRDLEWVIFDEVHYINDIERGVVWEEVLIMLPEHVSVILLSATVANVTDFAEWVGNTKRKHVYVVTTPRRPVPLEHYLYTGNSDRTSKELFKIISANDKNFNNMEYEKAKAALAFRKKTKKEGNQRPGRQSERNTVLSFVRMLERETLLPAVIFILSKKAITDLAEGLNTLDLTINKEKGMIREFVTKCVGRLKGSDRDLPQIVFLKELMIRGIAVHHSGILPLMKEVTELLFERGLIKLLLATETFAMGINMPTRTVVFDAIEKFDGCSKRLLRTSEYIQMAGRAGRRGKDETGTVIILCKGRLPDYTDLLSMVQGKPTDLSSHFKPTYNMILSVLKGRGLKVEEMLKRSFAEYEEQVKSRDYKREKKVLEKKLESLKSISCSICHNIEHYYFDGIIMMKLETDFKDRILNTAKASRSIHPGRVIVISTPKFPFHMATIVDSNLDKKKDIREMQVIVLHSKDYNSGLDPDKASVPWQRTVMSLKVSPGVNCRSTRDVMRPLSTEEADFTVCTVSLLDVACLLQQKVSTDVDVKKSLQHMRFNPSNWDRTPIDTLARQMMQIATPTELNYDVKDMDGVDLLENIRKQRGAMANYSCSKCLTFDDHIRQTSELLHAKSELDRIAYFLSYQSLQFMPEFQVRVRVLKRLRYLGSEDQLKLKGKAACAMSTSELVITELVFDNFFKDLEVEAIVAILSCMVFQQKRCSEPNLTPELKAAKKQFLGLAHRIVEAEVAEKLRANDADFEEQFRFGLVEVVYRWAKGEQFAEIMQYTDVDEGTIVRCITRLDEVLRCIKDVARIVGDVDFETKMEQASLTIKRDIVFAASLYVQ